MSDVKPLHVINNEDGEIIEIYEDSVRIIVPKLGFWKKMNRPRVAPSEGTYVFPLGDIQIQIQLEAVVVVGGRAHELTIQDKNRPERQIKLFARGLRRNDWTILEKYIGEKKAKKKERYLDYEGAILIYESIGKSEEAARIRKMVAEQNAVKVDQTVVHGDYVDDRDTTYVDDRDTIIQDSVVNKSNIGAGGKSKAEQIKEIKDLLDSGAIDDAEFRQMKKEILGK